jgi:ABC-type transport system substrate-binding protein
LRVVIGFVALALLAACSNTPPPPVVGTVTQRPSTAPPQKPGEIVVGVDSITGGYNPHVLADQSTITTALSTMMLPSVFRTAADGSPQLDRTLMISADVVKPEPYTVQYRLRGDAAWSDSAPIAAEDFVYLREQMRDEPGGVDSAGYRLISDIRAEEGGKLVEVTFSAPYPGWRSLFTSLLPAHLLKDAPGGWDQVLETGFPASGGPFSIKQLDMPRGEIVLERNERYWERPAVADRIVLRRADQPGLADALSTGHDQLVVARTNAAGAELLNGLGEKVKVQVTPRPSVVSVVLRPAGAVMQDERVRSALISLLDREALITAGTAGGPAAKLRADSLVLGPSQAGYAPTGPLPRDPAAAQQQLTQAGYTLVGSSWTKDGQPLTIVLGAPAEREPYLTVAKEIQRQLQAAGVQVKLVTPPGDQLLRPATEGSANIIVAPRPVSDNPVAVLASMYGCPVRIGDSATLPPGNITGFCDTSLQPTIDQALTGATPLPDAIANVEPRIWRQSVAIPLFQQADSVAVRSELTIGDVIAPLNAPFGSAVTWQRNPK